MLIDNLHVTFVIDYSHVEFVFFEDIARVADHAAFLQGVDTPNNLFVGWDQCGLNDVVPA